MINHWLTIWWPDAVWSVFCLGIYYILVRTTGLCAILPLLPLDTHYVYMGYPCCVTVMCELQVLLNFRALGAQFRWQLWHAWRRDWSPPHFFWSEAASGCYFACWESPQFIPTHRYLQWAKWCTTRPLQVEETWGGGWSPFSIYVTVTILIEHHLYGEWIEENLHLMLYRTQSGDPGPSCVFCHVALWWPEIFLSAWCQKRKKRREADSGRKCT